MQNTHPLLDLYHVCAAQLRIIRGPLEIGMMGLTHYLQKHMDVSS